MKIPARSRNIALSVVLLAITGGGAAYTLRAADRAPSQGGAATALGPLDSSSPRPGARAMRFDRARAPGLVHEYELRFDQDLALSDGQGKGSDATLRLHVGGTLSIAFVAHVDGKHRLFAELSNAALDLGERSARSAAVERELGRPFYILAEPDGRVRGYAFARGLSPIAQNILRGLVSSAQFSARDEAAWTAPEDDIQGTYVAAYSRGDDGVVKTKRPYDKIASSTVLVKPDETTAVETRARGVATIAEDGWLTKLTFEEDKKASMGASMPMATTHSRLEMFLVKTRSEPTLLGRFERDAESFVDASPFGTGDDAEASRIADTRLVGDLTMDDLLTSARVTEGEKQLVALGDKLSARLRLTPEDADRMASRASKLSAREGGALVSGLGGAGTKEATKALGKIVGSSGVNASLRAQAATALAFSGEHAIEAREPLIEALADPSREVRDSAALALGGVARELGDADEASVQELIRKYERAENDEERALLLQALGNSGAPEVLPIARAALASNSDALREAAAESLRFLPLGEADTVLGQTLVTDADESVRLAVIDSIGYRLVEMHAAALDRAIGSDSAGRVRGAVAQIASRALSTRGASLSPSARATLQNLVKKAA